MTPVISRRSHFGPQSTELALQCVVYFYPGAQTWQFRILLKPPLGLSYTIQKNTNVDGTRDYGFCSQQAIPPQRIRPA